LGRTPWYSSYPATASDWAGSGGGLVYLAARLAPAVVWLREPEEQAIPAALADRERIQRTGGGFVTTVTIFGAGNMARGIRSRLVGGNVEVQILAPQADEAGALAREVSAGGGSISGAAAAEPNHRDVVVLAGDDADSKSRVAELMADTALRAIESLRRARQLEHLGLHMVLEDNLGSGDGSAIKIVIP
jgi:hypothetical protein